MLFENGKYSDGSEYLRNLLPKSFYFSINIIYYTLEDIANLILSRYYNDYLEK
ncbi:hypothetical protein CLOLEP_00808 [[Clostridium] leptum DSM 753]|uniref:Uncharacterized protein n=1 Tax=[Clostridium] leptum DSM 753 TaxID=428125 RepID=A7VQH8_9FIRM|nr:hypothetical protein CLOLEP_00808 [[Clostridium] leptum DSM 753]